MTSYAKQAILGPVISPLVSKDKGDFSNRANCAGAQLVNNAKTLAQDVVVIGGVAAGAKAAKKCGKFAEIMAVPIEKLTKVLKNLAEKRAFQKVAKPEKGLPGVLSAPGNKIKAALKASKLNKLVEKMQNLPTKTKALIPIIALGTLALGYITSKGLYKMGQIDQKYTDKAKFEQRQKEVLD